MATNTVQADSAVQKLSPSTQAFLRAFEEYRRFDDTERNDEVDEKFASFAWAGAEYYLAAWPVKTADEAALSALVAFEKLTNIRDGHSIGSGAVGSTITLTSEVLAEFGAAQDAIEHVWRYLLERHPELAPLTAVAERYGVSSGAR